MLWKKAIFWIIYKKECFAVKGLNQTLETHPDQTSIVTCVRGINQKLKDQLVMKFQLAHFIAIHGKPFKLYSDFANFEKEFHNVDLGNSYLSDPSCHKMLTYLSRSIITNNITKPLNDGTIWYYSMHNDGSSSAKTMDKKELFIIKTAHKGEVKFNVMSLEEPNKANAVGLKAALENLIMKLGLNIERKERKVCFISIVLKLCWFFFFKFCQSAQKKLFLSTLLDDIYNAVHVHVSTLFFIRMFLWK